MISHVRETMRSSRDYVSCAQYQEVTNALKQLKNSQFENLNDICLCLQLVNEVKMEQVTVFVRNRESAFSKKGMFFDGELRRSENFARKRKLGFRYCATPIIMTLMPMFATYGVKVEQMILFMKIMKEYKYCFSARQFRRFDGSSVRIQGAETLYLLVFHSKHTASYTG